MKRALIAALLLSACAHAPHRTVRRADVDAWIGVPVIELETQPWLVTKPHRVERLSDGSELRVYSSCWQNDDESRCTAASTSRYTSSVSCRHSRGGVGCCYRQYRVRDGVVEGLHITGDGCFTTCETRPASRQCGPSGE